MESGLEHPLDVPKSGLKHSNGRLICDPCNIPLLHRIIVIGNRKSYLAYQKHTINLNKQMEKKTSAKEGAKIAQRTAEKNQCREADWSKLQW